MVQAAADIIKRESRAGEQFVAYFENGDSGLLENTSTTKQFIVPAGCKVNFRVRMGSPFAENPILLVNLPELASKTSGEEVKGSLDQPRTSDSLNGGSGETLARSQASTPEYISKPDSTAAISNNSEASAQLMYTMTQPIQKDGTRLEMGTGWPVSTTYLAKILPNRFMRGQQAPAQTYYEYTVEFQTAGSYFVQLEYGKRDQRAQGTALRYTKPSYINVEPLLNLEASQPPLKCKELSICTVLSRSLGPLERWPSVLGSLSSQGYNAIHFTPIQHYGESFSHYSLADQTQISDYYFKAESQAAQQTSISMLTSDTTSKESSSPGYPSPQAKFENVKQVMAIVKQEKKLFSIIDIVLNHTANNSEWIQEHPEACYNIDDVPRLYPAYLLDAELIKISHEFIRGGVSWCRSAPYLNNEQDLGQVIEEMTRRARSLQLHEFFLCNFDRSAFMNALPGLSQQQVMAKVDEFTKMGLFKSDPLKVVQEHFLEKLGHGPARRQVSLKQPDTAIFFTTLCQQNVTVAIEKVNQIVQQLNNHWSSTVTRWVDEAMQNCRGTMRYFKLELKRNHITHKNLLLDPYFSTLNNSAQSKVVHNGWIGDHNPLVDFALEKDFSYLRRHVNIWGDSIKLRYGECPASSPYLWQHMGQYVTQMATLFDGFRLDNAHSTPMHVCQYMLQLARCQNPNLFVMAELFTSSAEMDALFTTRLNINGMIREIMNKGDVGSVGAYFHEITCQEAVLGKLDQDFEYVHEPNQDGSANNYKVLQPTKPSDVIYDCTHDNPAPLEKFGTRRLALPTIGLLSLADQIIATTWGYDQLLPENLSVVKESRLYPVEVDPSTLWVEDNTRDQQERNQSIDFSFRYQTSGNCGQVCVAGEFNSWQPTLQMQRGHGSNEWTVTMAIGPELQGRRVQFKFVEDGCRWSISHQLPKVCDQQGNENNFFELGGGRSSFDSQQKMVKLSDLRVPRMLLNRAHAECTKHGAEIFMHSQTDDTLVVVRQLPLAHSEDYDAFVSVQRFPFSGCNEASISTTVELPGFISEVIFAANNVDHYQLPKVGHITSNSETVIKSPPSEVFMHNSLQAFARVIEGTQSSRLEFFNMPQGFTCLLKTRTQSHIKQAVQKLDKLLTESSYQFAQKMTDSGRLSLTEINHLLYRCDNEEKDISGNQRGPYGLPDEGQFVYSGLQGPLHLLQQLKLSGNLGHSLMDNIRSGDWLCDYTLSRVASQLSEMPRLQGVHDIMSQAFSEVKKLPLSYKPRYVSRVIEKIFNASLSLMTHVQMESSVAFSRTPDPFLQSMVLACAQMYARVPSMVFKQFKSSMCAGLPHFSTGYMRCWGRDTFISLRGLFLTTGLYKEAKETILFFAKVERHGLIPNLHDQGNNTRFNARDATWFFLQAIKDYIMMADDGLSILAERYEAEFESQWVMTIEQLVMKILQAHADGINFREWNAGTRIDEQMKDNGFNVRVEADLAQTGFCFGGNADNCGTWMDKMGSAALINKGVPATPRDGAPIELVGLQYSVLSYLAKLNNEGKFPHAGVKQITFQAWAELIKASFTKCFYVPIDPQADCQFDVQGRFVNRRGIYKDSYKSTDGYTDYQLRPNLCIAMAVAPVLFDRVQAQKCLAIVEDVLMTEGAMGIKTLDPSDRQYKGDYDNDDETRGHNYHQGPEWVWPVGFFLISKLNFCDYSSQREAAQDIVKHLLPHQEHMLKNDPWHSLPELTNSNGKTCYHSCPAQAWSIATLLDALHRLGFYKAAQGSAVAK